MSKTKKKHWDILKKYNICNFDWSYENDQYYMLPKIPNYQKQADDHQFSSNWLWIQGGNLSITNNVLFYLPNNIPQEKIKTMQNLMPIIVENNYNKFFNRPVINDVDEYFDISLDLYPDNENAWYAFDFWLRKEYTVDEADDINRDMLLFIQLAIDIFYKQHLIKQFPSNDELIDYVDAVISFFIREMKFEDFFNPSYNTF